MRSSNRDNILDRYEELNAAIMQAVDNNNGVLDESVYLNDVEDARRRKENPLLKTAAFTDQFMSRYAGLLTTEQLFNLTTSLMEHHIKHDVDSPLLRGQGLITGHLYIELAKRLKYNPAKNYNHEQPQDFDPKQNDHPVMNYVNHLAYKNLHEKHKVDAGGVASTVVFKTDAESIEGEALGKNFNPQQLMQLMLLAQQRSGIQSELSRGEHAVLRDSIVNASVLSPDPPKPESDYFAQFIEADTLRHKETNDKLLAKQKADAEEKQRFEAEEPCRKLLAQIDSMEKAYHLIEIEGKIGRKSSLQESRVATSKAPPKQQHSAPTKSIKTSKNEGAISQLKTDINNIINNTKIDPSAKQVEMKKRLEQELQNQYSKGSGFFSKKARTEDDFIKRINEHPTKHHYTRMLAIVLRDNGSDNNLAKHINPPTDPKIQQKYGELMQSSGLSLRSSFK